MLRAALRGRGLPACFMWPRHGLDGLAPSLPALLAMEATMGRWPTPPVQTVLPGGPCVGVSHTLASAAAPSPSRSSHLHPRAPVNPWGCLGNLFLLFASCLPNKFDSTVGSPRSRHPIPPTLQHPGPSPACVPPPSTHSQPRRVPEARSCPGVLAPASPCQVTVSGGDPVAGPYPRTETSCRNLPSLVGRKKKIISQF